MTRISTQHAVFKTRSNAAAPLLADGWPATGLLRVDQIIGGGRLPISKSQFWVLVRQKGLMAVRLSPRVTAFWVHDLRRVFFGEEYVVGLALGFGDQPIAVDANSMINASCSATTPDNTTVSAISKAAVNSDGRRPVTTTAK